MSTYRKKNYRGKRYSGRPHRRSADSYHQPMPNDQNRIPIARHTLTKPDVEACVDALLSGNLTQGKELDRFESLLAKLTHSDHAIAVNSGAAAFHTAVAALKLEPEDEVIVSTLHDGRVASMIKLTGAQPVFVDVDPETHTMSLDAAKAAVTEHTKAIFTNNFGGHASDLEGLRAIAEEHHLVLLDDASHGLGGKYRGHYVGNQADVTCFTFDPDMAITTCLGGAITTNNRPMADWFRQFRVGGIQSESRHFQTGGDHPGFYHEIQILGMHYELSEVHAALGRSQLTRLDRHIERRRSIAQVYQQKLENIEGLVLPESADWADHAYHFYAIRLEGPLADKRDELYKQLTSASIGATVHAIPLHRMPLFAGDAGPVSAYPNAERYYQTALSLPLFPDLSYKDLERITDLIQKTLGHPSDQNKGDKTEGDDKQKSDHKRSDNKSTKDNRKDDTKQDETTESKGIEAPPPDTGDAMQDLEDPAKKKDGDDAKPARRGRTPKGRTTRGRASSRSKAADKDKKADAGDQSAKSDDKTVSKKPTKSADDKGAGKAPEAKSNAKSGKDESEPKPKRTRRPRTATKASDKSSKADDKTAKEDDKEAKPKRTTRAKKAPASKTTKTTRTRRTTKSKDKKDDSDS